MCNVLIHTPIRLTEVPQSTAPLSLYCSASGFSTQANDLCQTGHSTRGLQDIVVQIKRGTLLQDTLPHSV